MEAGHIWQGTQKAKASQWLEETLKAGAS